MPCAQLHRHVADSFQSAKRRSRLAKNALLLSGVYTRIGQCVVADKSLDLERPIQPTRWHSAVEPGSVRVNPLCMVWDRSPTLAHAALHKTYALMQQMPVPVALQVLDWAPPLVLKPNRKGERVVIANHFSAALARFLLYDQSIRVTQLKKAVSLRRSFDDIAILSVQLLADLFECNKPAIASAAQSLEEAQLVTGMSRAWCASSRAPAGSG